MQPPHSKSSPPPLHWGLEPLEEESDYLSDAESSPTRSTLDDLEEPPTVESSPAAFPLHVIPGSWIDELDIDRYTLSSDTEERETIEEGDDDDDDDDDIYNRGRESCQIKLETMPLEMIAEEFDGEEEDGAEEEGVIRQVTRRSMIISPQTGTTDSLHSCGTLIGGYSDSESTLAAPMKSKGTKPQIQIPSEETMDNNLEISIDSLDCSSSPSSSPSSSTTSFPTGTESPESTPGSRPRGRAPHVKLPDEVDLEQRPGVHQWEESAVACVEKSQSPSPSIAVSPAECSSGSSSSSISTTSDPLPEVDPATLVQPKTSREHDDLAHPRTRANSLDTGLTARAGARKEEERQDPQVDTKAPVAPRLKARPATSSSTARPPFHSFGLRQTQVEAVTWQSFFLASPSTSTPPRTVVHRPVPPQSVIVRVLAVGLDGVDGLLAAGKTEEDDDGDPKSGRRTRQRQEESVDSWSSGSWPDSASQPTQGTKTRNPFAKLSQALSSHLGKQKRKKSMNASSPSASTLSLNLTAKGKTKLEPRAPTTGSALAPHIPGRSFVGRLAEIGENVEEEMIAWSDHRLRKGDWVVGLVDVKKGGALAEFVTVDWRCVHQVPEEWIAIPSGFDDHTGGVEHPFPSSSEDDSRQNKLTLEELALLPLCGIPAYRAVSTILEAFAVDHHRAKKEYSDSTTTTTTDETDSSASQDDTPHHKDLPHPTTRYRRQRERPRRTRRALILRGTDGAGALATQMLVRLGWRVSIHAPFSRVPENATQELAEAYMCSVEELARSWGADEVIFDDAEAAREREEGEDSDSHWRMREAVVRVMEMARMEGDVFDAVLDTVGGTEIREAAQRLLRATDMGHFTTLVGDEPELAIPTTTWCGDHAGYSCVNVAHEDEYGVSEMLGTILKLAMKPGVRPVVEEASGDTFGREPRVIGFDRAFDVFMDGKNRPSTWWLANGGTLVTKLV